jgi:hypothetical protein
MSIPGPGHGEKITRRREAAIVALLTCSSLPAAAEACNLSERTLRRWLRDPVFAERFREERALLLAFTVNALAQKSIAAVSTLARIAENQSASEAAQVSAAGRLLELRLKGSELLDVQEQLAELEQIVRDK